MHFTNAWHPESGGIRTFYAALLDRAEATGRHMTLVVPGERDATLRRGATTRIQALASPLSPLFDRRYRVMLPHRALWSARVRQLMAHDQPDLVEVSDKYTLSYLAGSIKVRRGPRPTVVGLSQERFDDALLAQIGRHRPTRAFARWYMREIYLRQFDAHIANSEYTAAELRAAAVARGPRAWRHWRLRDRIHVLPLGVDSEGFHPGLRSEAIRIDMLRRARGSQASALIVFAGRLSPEKHVNTLVPALDLLLRGGMDVRLVIAGDGPLRAAIERDSARYMAGRCVVIGHVDDRAWLARLIASADLFLHPNPCEPFGIGPLEAMAAGVPVVLPRSGGVLSYADDDTAWLTSPGAAGLAEGIRDCLANGAEAARRARMARAMARRLDWPGVADRYFAAYDAIDDLRRHAWSSDVAVDRQAIDRFVGVAHRER